MAGDLYLEISEDRQVVAGLGREGGGECGAFKTYGTAPHV